MKEDSLRGGGTGAVWVAACLLGLLGLGLGCSGEHAPPPNVVIILADDLGYGGIGAFGNTVLETPRLDSLAANGLVFTDFHSNGAVCTPSRAALLTGNYPQRSGLEGVIYARGATRQVGLDTSVVTLADRFRAAGYATGITGKWHLGYRRAYNPVRNGFDSFRGYVSGNIDYQSHYDGAGIFDWWHDLDTVREEGYVTDLITDHAVDFIDDHREQPFFLYIAHEAPHVPFQGRKDTAFRYPDRPIQYAGPVEDTAATYREMVEVMDEGIGRVADALAARGLAENTLLFFFSDNGARAFGHNGPLRGNKGSLWEGGHRVPAIAYWPGRIRPGVSDATLTGMDLHPTLLALAGQPVPPGQLDGVDFSPTLLEGAGLPERSLFWRYRERKVARRGPWKLVVTPADTLLFKLDEDLRERHDRSARQPELRTELLRQLAAWEADVGGELKTE